MVNISEIARYLQSLLLAKGIKVQELILFGSYATGSPSEDSDIDLALVSPSFNGNDLYERAEMVAAPVAKTIWEFNIPIDLITLTPEEYSNKDKLITASLENGKKLIFN